MKRQLLSLALAVILIVQMFPSAAMAAAEKPGVSAVGVSLKLAAAPWDGLTETEPPTDDAGVYQIGTGAELAWFRSEVNRTAASAAKAVLTADIDLGRYNWVPIGTRIDFADQYQGSFDGLGHLVSGLSVTGTEAYQGFFGLVEDATIQNLRVEGSVSSTKNYVGGIVGTTRNTTIQNCSFAGTVSSTDAKNGYVGGIVGGNQSTPSVFSGCVNMAAVTGKMAGGILGYSTQKNTIENCYNTGAITGALRSGGIVGQASAGSIASCYNIGPIAGASTTPGGIYSVSNATITNSYHLYPADEAPGGLPTGRSTKISAPDELDALLADGVFVPDNGNNSGYPVLAWQTPPDTTPAINLRGDSTLYAEQGAGLNATTISLVTSNIDADALGAVVWSVATEKGSAAPEEIVDWQTAEGDDTHLIVTANGGGVVTVTATVSAQGETLTATRSISVIPQITTAQIANANELGTIAIGQTLAVKVFVAGGKEYDYDNYPPLSFAWRYGTHLPSGDITGATGRSYTVPTTVGYAEWQWLYVEIASGGRVVKQAQDVRGQLRSADYGTLYPVAYDPAFALPAKVRDNSPLTLPATHSVDGVAAAISWTSDKPETIAPDGTVRRPATGTATVTLTAKFVYGGAFANRTFAITVYSDAANAADADKTYLQAAADALGEWYGPMAPVYGRDTNLIQMLKADLAELGYGDVAVALKSATELHDGGSIAPGGGISYFYADPNSSRGLWFGQYRVVFTLTKGADSLDTKELAVNLNWNRDRAQEVMRSEILSGVTDTVVLAQNQSPQQVVTDLVLPRVVDGKRWAQVSWVSSDPGAVFVDNSAQDSADTLFAPYVGKVIRGAQDTEVTLTAKFTFNRTTLGEPEIVLYKTFTFTINALASAEADALRAQLLQTLEAGFAAAGLRDFVTGEQLTATDGVYTVANDLQLPTTRDFGVDGKYYPITIASSNDTVALPPDVANAARVTVYRPAMGAAAEPATLTISITDLARGISASKKLSVLAEPLTDTELADALTLMEQTKAAYFAGLNAERYADEFSVTGGLRPFQEAVWDDSKNGLRWIYDAQDATGSGIVADELDNWAEQEAWRAFRSSDMTVLDHETLNHVAQPAEDTFVRINSVLTHAVYGKYAGLPGYEGFEPLARQPVAVYVMVAGKNHPPRTREELERMRSAAIAKIEAPVSAGFTLLGTKARAKRQAVAAATGSFGEILIQTTMDGLDAGTTVFGLFRKALAQQGYTYKAVGSYIKSVTDAEGNTLSERDNGPNSGWIYTVNGKMPSIYMNGYALKEGDEVEVRFTDDYTKENGMGNETGGQGTGGSSDAAKQPANTGVLGNSVDTAPATAAQAKDAVAQLAANKGVRLVNVTGISPAVAAQIAKSVAPGTLIFADTVVNDSIVSRFYLSPALLSKRTSTLDTRVDVTAQGTAAARQLFGPSFTNTMAFAKLGQTGPLGMTVRIALRLDLTGLNTQTLVAYVYDEDTNAYTQLAKPRVDKNGFVYLYTDRGGSIILTDSALTRR